MNMHNKEENSKHADYARMSLGRSMSDTTNQLLEADCLDNQLAYADETENDEEFGPEESYNLFGGQN